MHAQASRLAGDYRSGKRLNMKRVIQYIASRFRKDKIWMRRTRPDKRQYQARVLQSHRVDPCCGCLACHIQVTLRSLHVTQKHRLTHTACRDMT